jgi:hypothetical protein
MDAFQLLEEAGKVPPAESAAIDAAIDLVLAAASQEGSRAGSAPSPGRLRPRRHRRKVLAATASTAAAVAATAFLAVTTLAPASHKPSVQLAAWTVVKQANGDISVTLRQLRDPAGLQYRLREAGVPASVTFGGHQNPACQPYPASSALLDMVFLRPPAPAQPNQKLPSGHHLPPAQQRDAVTLVIHPSALPSGTGVQLAATAHSGQGAIFDVRDLAYASPQCTGSS